MRPYQRSHSQFPEQVAQSAPIRSRHAKGRPEMLQRTVFALSLLKGFQLEGTPPSFRWLDFHLRLGCLALHCSQRAQG